VIVVAELPRGQRRAGEHGLLAYRCYRSGGSPSEFCGPRRARGGSHWPELAKTSARSRGKTLLAEGVFFSRLVTVGCNSSALARARRAKSRKGSRPASRAWKELREDFGSARPAFHHFITLDCPLLLSFAARSGRSAGLSFLKERPLSSTAPARRAGPFSLLGRVTMACNSYRARQNRPLCAGATSRGRSSRPSSGGGARLREGPPNGAAA
jgi:hypothetical protein